MKGECSDSCAQQRHVTVEEEQIPYLRALGTQSHARTATLIHRVGTRATAARADATIANRRGAGHDRVCAWVSSR